MSCSGGWLRLLSFSYIVVVLLSMRVGLFGVVCLGLVCDFGGG